MQQSFLTLQTYKEKNSPLINEKIMRLFSRPEMIYPTMAGRK